MSSPYAEASYFDGFHFAHIAAWEHHQHIHNNLNRQRKLLRYR